jgi:hypothetical protein
MDNSEVMELELNAVVLPVEDVRDVGQWYVTQLDMDIVQESDDSMTLAGPNGFALELRQGRPLDHPERVHLLVHADNIEVIFGRLNDAQIQPLTDPQVTRHGRRVVTTRDRAGHTVEVFELSRKDATQDLSMYDKVEPGRVSAS